MMQATEMHVADIHGRTLTHGLQAFEDLDFTGTIFFACQFSFFFFSHFLKIGVFQLKVQRYGFFRYKPQKIGILFQKQKRLYGAKNGQIFNIAKFSHAQENKKPFREKGLFVAF